MLSANVFGYCLYSMIFYARGPKSDWWNGCQTGLLYPVPGFRCCRGGMGIGLMFWAVGKSRVAYL